MKKTLIILTLFLVGCASEEFTKTQGEVAGKYIASGRYGNYCEIKIAYKDSKGRFIINEFEVDKDSYGKYQPGQQLTLYANDNRVGGIITK